ncbi:MAG TPA: hypothetical protein VNL98_02895 [Gemmatimonadales bacterium]|nr:hypothetical protein [Gemmatimonadales bacterium]
MGERTWVKGELHAVTGAYGYSGRYIARRLLAEGVRVRTLTNSVPVSDPFAAIGPETFTYRELVGMIGRAIGHPRPVVAMPPALALAFATAMGWALRDVLITREEIQGLMMGLLHVDASPAGSTRLSDWAVAHGATLGIRYASELGRRTARGGA